MIEAQYTPADIYLYEGMLTCYEGTLCIRVNRYRIHRVLLISIINPLFLDMTVILKL